MAMGFEELGDNGLRFGDFDDCFFHWGGHLGSID